MNACARTGLAGIAAMPGGPRFHWQPAFCRFGHGVVACACRHRWDRPAGPVRVRSCDFKVSRFRARRRPRRTGWTSEPNVVIIRAVLRAKTARRWRMSAAAQVRAASWRGGQSRSIAASSGTLDVEVIGCTSRRRAPDRPERDREVRALTAGVGASRPPRSRGTARSGSAHGRTRRSRPRSRMTAPRQ